MGETNSSSTVPLLGLAGTLFTGCSPPRWPGTRADMLKLSFDVDRGMPGSLGRLRLRNRSGTILWDVKLCSEACIWWAANPLIWPRDWSWFWKGRWTETCQHVYPQRLWWKNWALSFVPNYLSSSRRISQVHKHIIGFRDLKWNHFFKNTFLSLFLFLFLFLFLSLSLSLSLFLHLSLSFSPSLSLSLSLSPDLSRSLFLCLVSLSLSSRLSPSVLGFEARNCNGLVTSREERLIFLKYTSTGAANWFFNNITVNPEYFVGMLFSYISYAAAFVRK